MSTFMITIYCNFRAYTLIFLFMSLNFVFSKRNLRFLFSLSRSVVWPVFIFSLTGFSTTEEVPLVMWPPKMSSETFSRGRRANPEWWHRPWAGGRGRSGWVKRRKDQSGPPAFPTQCPSCGHVTSLSLLWWFLPPQIFSPQTMGQNKHWLP